MSSMKGGPPQGGNYYDAVALYNECLAFLPELEATVAKLEAALFELVQVKIRQESIAAPANVGRLRAMHSVEGIFTELRDNILVKLLEFDSRFLDLAKNEKALRKSHFYRARHLMEKLEREKLSLLFLLHRHIEMMLQLVACRNATTTPAPASSSHSDWLYVLECADQLNEILRDDKSLKGTGSRDERPVRSLVHACRNRSNHIHENFFPQYKLRIQEITSSRMLHALAQQRSWLAAQEVAKSIVVGLEQRQLQMAAEDVSWLTVPMPTLDCSTGKAVSVFPVSQAANAKNKDGNGNKRKNRGSSLSEQASPSNFTSVGSDSTHLGVIEDFVANEENFLNGFFNVLSQVPGLVARSVLKPSKSGEGDRISRSACQRMAEYYHDHLWQGVGELTEQCVLWQVLPGHIHLPFALQHPQVTLGLSNIIQETMYAQLGEGYPALVFPTMHLLAESLNLHVISTAWDLQFLKCLAESTQPKSSIVDVTEMRSGDKATKTGKLFYDTLKSTCRLNNRCHPDMIRDFVEHGTHDAEEYPFSEELQVLRRLEATMMSMRNWSSGRANATLHNWQVKEFLLITQCDLFNMQDCFEILQLETHESLLNVRSLNIQFFIHLQQTVSKQIQDCTQHVKGLPAKTLQDMSQVCRTYSLATLKNMFPNSSHWKHAHTKEPAGPSPYVSEYIERVLGPVLDALVPMKVEIQQNVARIIIKTFCEAWLEHIRNRRIKFSDWGAQQISVDFTSLRHWISKNPNLKEDSRRYLLLLDSIRQCEGVAKLLQSKPGEVLDIRPAKNKVAPITDEEDMTGRCESPVHQVLDAIPAELYVRDQQQWISLKKSSTMIKLPFCCR